jgi:hypothetical protein
MKQFSFLSNTLGRLLFIPALLMIVLTVDSCQKDKKLSIAQPDFTMSTRSAQIQQSLDKVLRGFVTSQAGGSSQQSFAGGGSGIFSNVTMSKTTFPPPSQRSVYTWSDPATPTTLYTFTVNENSAGGLGQLSYNGKSFDYNFALSINIAAGSTDPVWQMTAGANAIHMIVAIDGDMGDTEFTFRNLAFFMAVSSSGEGTFSLGDWSAGASGTIGIGELLDFSAVPAPATSTANAKFYYTSAGHMDVTATTFTMGSDAKVKDVDTGSEYSIDGALMSE